MTAARDFRQVILIIWPSTEGSDLLILMGWVRGGGGGGGGAGRSFEKSRIEFCPKRIYRSW